MLCSLGADPTQVERQAKELMSLLKLRFPKDIPDSILCDLRQLGTDIVICKEPATVLAREGNQILIRFHFGERYEGLMSALRTGEKSSIVHALDSLSENPRLTSSLA